MTDKETDYAENSIQKGIVFIAGCILTAGTLSVLFIPSEDLDFVPMEYEYSLLEARDICSDGLVAAFSGEICSDVDDAFVVTIIVLLLGLYLVISRFFSWLDEAISSLSKGSLGKNGRFKDYESASSKLEEIFTSALQGKDLSRAIASIPKRLEKFEGKWDELIVWAEEKYGPSMRSFESLDTDGDGVLSKEEFEAAEGIEEGEFERLDADGDGELTLEEFAEFDIDFDDL